MISVYRIFVAFLQNPTGSVHSWFLCHCTKTKHRRTKMVDTVEQTRLAAAVGKKNHLNSIENKREKKKKVTDFMLFSIINH